MHRDPTWSHVLGMYIHCLNAAFGLSSPHTQHVCFHLKTKTVISGLNFGLVKKTCGKKKNFWVL